MQPTAYHAVFQGLVAVGVSFERSCLAPAGGG